MDYIEDGSDLLGLLPYLCSFLLCIKEKFRLCIPSLSTCLAGLNNYFLAIYLLVYTHK